MLDITYDFPNGPANLAALFPQIKWKDLAEYYCELFDSDDQIVMTTPINKVTNEWAAPALIRVHFLNYIGRYDSITFIVFTKSDDVKSQNWTKPLPSTPAKTDYGMARMQVRAQDVYSATTFFYDEAAQKWLEQLLESPLAFLELDTLEGQPADYIPVVIADKVSVTRKDEERYVYETNIEFRVANEKIGIRI